MSNFICEIEDIKCILVFGYNVVDLYLIVVCCIFKVKEKGVKVIVCDLCYIEIVCIVDLWLLLKNGFNMVLVNVFVNVFIIEEFYDKDYVLCYIEGFDEYCVIVVKYMLEYVESIIGLLVYIICEVMCIYVVVFFVIILWGMGVIQWGQGVDVVKGLFGLVLLMGNLGWLNVGVGLVCG